MIVWTDNGNARFGEGYGDASSNLYESIKKSGISLVKDEPKRPDWIDDVQMGYIYSSNIKADILINHSTPDAYNKTGDYNIGFSYWETNKLPHEWVNYCNQMDEIWTASNFMRAVFVNSGVIKPVYNFDLGVDERFYFPVKRKPHSQFTFLSMGSPSTRKNSQVAVDAFLKLFSGKDNYKLIYKSSGPPDARMSYPGEIRKLNHPQIEIIEDKVSVEELAAIYDRADCLLYPTSGEGWGLIPFQAIAKGIPTICTNFSACEEFAEMSIPLSYSLSDYKMSGIYENAGYWAKPDYDDLCDKMLYVTKHYEEVSEKTYSSAVHINENMTWQKVAKGYADRLCQILK